MTTLHTHMIISKSIIMIHTISTKYSEKWFQKNEIYHHHPAHHESSSHPIPSSSKNIFGNYRILSSAWSPKMVHTDRIKKKTSRISRDPTDFPPTIMNNDENNSLIDQYDDYHDIREVMWWKCNPSDIIHTISTKKISHFVKRWSPLDTKNVYHNEKYIHNDPHDPPIRMMITKWSLEIRRVSKWFHDTRMWYNIHHIPLEFPKHEIMIINVSSRSLKTS